MTISTITGKHDATYWSLGSARDFNIVTLPFKDKFWHNHIFKVSVMVCNLESKLHFLIVSGSLLMVTPSVVRGPVVHLTPHWSSAVKLVSEPIPFAKVFSRLTGRSDIIWKSCKHVKSISLTVNLREIMLCHQPIVIFYVQLALPIYCWYLLFPI